MKFSVVDLPRGLFDCRLIKQVGDDAEDDDCLFDTFEEAKEELISWLADFRDQAVDAMVLLDNAKSVEDV
ncbi:MAG: hypothetical protein HQ567_11030 [Candidatus Nealsonbacteria bacterium]|nr:hypothetical protein [Candidatus Nealsonbacteria bacterium]